MAILLNDETRVVVHGITGNAGTLHSKGMLDYGTKVVAGVRPGAAGQEVNGVKVFDNAKDAVAATNANTSILFVPAKFAKDSAIEAIDAGIKTLVIIPEHVPIHDTLYMVTYARKHGATIVGPNTAGMIAPLYKCKVGFVPDKFFTPGNVLIASRSGTLMYEFAARLNDRGIGQSFCVGVGGDPVVGIRFADVMRLAEKDDDTRAVLLIGEIGGTQEEEAAELVESKAFTKPVFAYIAGRYAPKERAMGHAGALIAGITGTMESKLGAFDKAGIFAGKVPGEVIDAIGETVK